MGKHLHDYILLSGKTSRHEHDSVYNTVRSERAVSAFPSLPTRPDQNLARIYCHPTKYDRVNRIKLPYRLTHLSIHILWIVLPIDITRWRLVLQCQSSIADLSWQPIFEIKQTCLADILDFGACLTNDRMFCAHSWSWVPAEDSERSITGTAFPTKLLFRL